MKSQTVQEDQLLWKAELSSGAVGHGQQAPGLKTKFSCLLKQDFGRGAGQGR